jgi:hypothetical protein
LHELQLHIFLPTDCLRVGEWEFAKNVRWESFV